MLYPDGILKLNLLSLQISGTRGREKRGFPSVDGCKFLTVSYFTNFTVTQVKYCEFITPHVSDEFRSNLSGVDSPVLNSAFLSTA